jgi:putative transcriptional regulator
MTYSQAIKKLRLSMCLTQNEFGRIFGVTFGTVNRWESGKFTPTMKIKRQMMSYFEERNIKIDELED